jgi:cytochrome c peroxidase
MTRDGALTHNPSDDHKWKIPTWRNVALTAPYFHNGSVATLDEAVRVMARTQLNTTLSEDQVSDVVEFLKALSGDFPKQELPRLPETPGSSLLYPGT